MSLNIKISGGLRPNYTSFMKNLISMMTLYSSVLLAGPASSSDFLDLEGKTGAEIFKSICFQCHGEKGEGKIELRSPSIAGMPKWYALLQLKNFKLGLRGSNPRDTSGLMMHHVARQMSEVMMENVSEYIQQLEPFKINNTLKGDPVRGKWLWQDYCMACHRYNASGEVVFGSPPLLYLQDWYLKDQMLKFAFKLRGSHPKDLKGSKMIDAMSLLPDTKAIDDILAYVTTLSVKSNSR